MAQYISKILLNSGLPEDSYFLKIPAIKYLINNTGLDFNSNLTVLTGENGTGKSTLLEAIAIAFGFNPEGGTLNFSFTTADTHSNLADFITIARRDYPKDGFFLRAESFYNAASYIDNIYSLEREMNIGTPYGSISLHNQSHGESFISLVKERFAGNGLYILDEPEAALSPMRTLILLKHINALLQKNSQFIIATHSPIIMAYPDAQVLELSQNGIKTVNYQDTEHYKVFKSFFNDSERIFKHLFK